MKIQHGGPGYQGSFTRHNLLHLESPIFNRKAKTASSGMLETVTEFIG
jgi:hypothetical protein